MSGKGVRDLRHRFTAIGVGLIIVLQFALPVSASQETKPARHWTFNRPVPTEILLAVIPINFTKDQRSPGDPSRIGDVIFNEPNLDQRSESLVSYFDEASYGALSITGTVFPLVTVPASTGDCNGAYSGWGRAAVERLTAQGEDFDGYTHFMYVTTHRSCGHSGIADLSGDESTINLTQGWSDTPTGRNQFLHVVTHELSHNLGATHAGAIRCKEAGMSVPGITATCRAAHAFGRFGGSDTWEYGDNLDILGGNLWPKYVPQPSAISRFLMGFVTEDEMPIVEGTGEYDVELNLLYERGAAIKGIRIRRADPAPYGMFGMTDQGNAPEICLDWRRRQGRFDRFPAVVGSGISIRLCDATGSMQRASHGNSLLVDMSPGSRSGFRDWLDGALKVGQIFVDDVSGVTIELTSLRYNASDPAASVANLHIVIP